MRYTYLYLMTFVLLATTFAPHAFAQTPATEVSAQPLIASINSEESPTSAHTQLIANNTSAAATTQSAALATEQRYENLQSPVDLVASYYNAINRQEYQRAYNYWENPPSTYTAFAHGFADTAHVQVIVQPPTTISGAAGSLYVEVPVVLVANHYSGNIQTYAGCFVTRKSNLTPPDAPVVDVWHLYQAQLSLVRNNSSVPTLLAQGC
jgi:hypothetical protein